MATLTYTGCNVCCGGITCIPVCCCDNAVPSQLLFTIVSSGLGGPVACIGATTTLTYIGNSILACPGSIFPVDAWRGTVSCNGFINTYTLACTSVSDIVLGACNWFLCESCNGDTESTMISGYIGQPPDSCAPFSRAFNNGTDISCMGPGSRFLITAPDLSPALTNICPTCCTPSRLLPTTLYATITGSGSCDGTYTLVYNVSSSAWVLTPNTIGTCPGTYDETMALFCNFLDSGIWEIGTFDRAATRGPNPETFSCNPFFGVFDAVTLVPCCDSDATITVTETPP